MNGASENETTDWSAIRAQILADPARLREDETLLQALGLKLEHANVLEFGPAALARLEAARTREMTARQEIESVARANFAAQAQTHAMAVDLLESRNNSDLARRVDEGARARFGVVAGSICVEGPGPAPFGWRSLPSGLLDLLIGPDALARMGPCGGAAELFGEAAAAVKTAALVRMSLWSPARTGVLAFGSADPDGFTPDMGAELVAFLARVVERTAERWPAI
ncbi:MAG TPA: DUF484 family protein [Caulobacteraceae bacterium]|jgi:uncharacterized protein YigA (DUF484 family)|nr:DUF484 family protein [Caulobacteraceae bacterium]